MRRAFYCVLWNPRDDKAAEIACRIPDRMYKYDCINMTWPVRTLLRRATLIREEPSLYGGWILKLIFPSIVIHMFSAETDSFYTVFLILRPATASQRAGCMTTPGRCISWAGRPSSATTENRDPETMGRHRASYAEM